MNAKDSSLEEWLDLTAERRDELLAYAKTRIPGDFTGSLQSMDELLQNEADAYALLADAKSFIIQSEAQAVLDVRRKYEDLTACERRVMVKNSIRDIQRLIDGLVVIARTLTNKRFVQMNANRSGS